MKKGSFSTAILILIFLIGLSLLLYPTVSDYWNSLHQTRAIADYAEEVAKLDDARYEQLWNDAVRYNEALPLKADRYQMSDEERKEYESLLNVSGNGIIGYIEIPRIACSLPIYHGTNEAVLQIAVGHIEGTSLPVGGAGCHCVLSGHRGLPSAKLFTDLDKLQAGDDFILRVLDETLTYEVDRILIVEPHEMEPLEIDPDQDYCTPRRRGFFPLPGGRDGRERQSDGCGGVCRVPCGYAGERRGRMENARLHPGRLCPAGRREVCGRRDHRQ